MKNIMQEAQKLQAKLLEELKKIKVEGSAGGGMVVIEMDGQQNVVSVKIEPQILEEKDVSMLEDLILAALNDAKKKVADKTKESFSFRPRDPEYRYFRLTNMSQFNRDLIMWNGSWIRRPDPRTLPTGGGC